MMKNKVFISYAREDCDIAKKIYIDLTNNGVETWLDSEILLPGQKWKAEIKKAIKGSNFFLALISSNSISKRGHIQKELKTAFDVVDELPSDDIFIIPVKINSCEPVDDKLLEIHWVDLFPSYQSGLKKILQVIGIKDLKKIKNISNEVVSIYYGNIETAAANATIIENEQVCENIPMNRLWENLYNNKFDTSRVNKRNLISSAIYLDRNKELHFSPPTFGGLLKKNSYLITSLETYIDTEQYCNYLTAAYFLLLIW
ncbi:toll/interleukin-1 receptor domain-containing protein [Desulfococcaceae bacterium HSG9]|nr:toll/interleukin-1 receptor domain-containing protein [Desulfococcaceae bacterium HSG9]